MYDTGNSSATLISAFNRALAEGAELIVGPVQRENVEVLLGQGTTVPVLALNYVDDMQSPNVFQFGLSPDQEARQAAERARRDAGSRALVLYPDDAWGRRLHDAFVERFTELGGVIVDQAAFPPTEADYSTTLEQLLALNESESRKQSLRSMLGQPLEFEPRRRYDVDFAFLAARPNQARSIKPQLRFHRASDLPVYATSSVFSGRADPDVDRDMDGILFCDIPWLLGANIGVPDRESVTRALPGAEGSLARLYALGIDAYQMAPYLEWLHANPGDAFPGNTGWLSMDTDGRVYRQLLWARFLGGRPRLVNSTGQAVAGN
jgi:outer membrane PBP1 activator LpoA protein